MGMQNRKAFSLMELAIALCIIVALAGMMVPLCADSLTSASENTTRTSLSEIRNAMAQYWLDTKHWVLDGVTTSATEAGRFDIRWLFYNPVTNDRTVQFDPNLRSGWNGPYISVSTANQALYGNAALCDGWNRLITVQYINPTGSLKDVRLVSPGRDGIVNLPAGTATTALTTSDVGDDIYVAITLR